MKVDIILKAEPELTGEQFMRAVLLEIAAYDKAPADIFTALSFSEPNLTTDEVIVTRTEVHLDYTCEIGYDRTENYYDNWTKKMEKRTVTDWRPFSGSTSSEELVVVRKGETDPKKVVEYDATMRTYLKTLKKGYISDDVDSLDLDAQTVSIIVGFCKSRCFGKVVLPGAWNRRANYTGTVDVKTCEVWELPQYTLEYTYGDNRYSAKSYAAGKSKIDVNMPTEKQIVDKHTINKIFPLFAFGALLFTIGVLLMYCIPNAPEFLGIVLFYLGIVLTAIFLLLYYLFRKKALKNNKEKRIDQLKILLSKMNLSPLTESECEEIMKNK